MLEDVKTTFSRKLVVSNDYGVITWDKTGVEFLLHFDGKGNLMYRESVNAETPNSFVPCLAGKKREIRAQHADGRQKVIWKHGKNHVLPAFFNTKGGRLNVDHYTPVVHHTKGESAIMMKDLIISDQSGIVI